MNDLPAGRASTLDMFRPVDTSTSLSVEQARIRLQRLEEDDRTICRWCLERFDSARQQPRTTWERGQLRTRLKMADNGSELVICDNCWHGARGSAVFMHGQAVPTQDPEIIPNLLLRQFGN